MAKIICFDFDNCLDENYEKLIQAIQKRYPNCCRITETCWLVSTLDNPIQIKEKLSPLIPSKDKLFVGMLIPGFYNASWTRTLSDNQEVNDLLNHY
jgi:hypothetical protein